MKVKNKGEIGSFELVLLCVCVFVGVGFITGEEIWCFFAKFGASSIFGIICFSIVSFFLILFSFLDDKHKPNKFENAVCFFSELMISSAMISGLKDILKGKFSSYNIILIVVIFMLFLMLVLGLKSFRFYNCFVFAFILFVFIKLFLFKNYSSNKIDIALSSINAIKSIIFAIIYIFMNIAELRPILKSCKYSKKQKIAISVVIVILLSFMIFALDIILLKNNQIANKSMPFMLLFNNENYIVKEMFFYGLVGCLVSTCQSCLYGVEKKLFNLSKDKIFSCVVSILVSVLFSQISFDFFVEFIYPTIGVMNLLLFIFQIFSNKFNR